MASGDAGVAAEVRDFHLALVGESGACSDFCFVCKNAELPLLSCGTEGQESWFMQGRDRVNYVEATGQERKASSVYVNTCVLKGQISQQAVTL